MLPPHRASSGLARGAPHPLECSQPVGRPAFLAPLTATVPSRPLLERATELAALDLALLDAEAGSTRIVVVRGEPGIGKSSLLDHAVDRAVRRGFAVRRATFTVVSEQTAHGLLWEWFGAEAYADAVAPVFDGPAEMLRGVLRGERTAEPVALTYAAQWAISGLDEEQPLLLAVDDLQWADAASRRLLTTLAARLLTERVAIVIAARPDPGTDADPAVAAMLASPRTTLLEPRPLSLEAVGALADGTGADAARVLEASGGVPFYVRELIDHGTDPGPARVREGLRERLAALPADARAVVETAAVGASGIDPAVIADAADVSPARLAELLPQLAAAGLVERREERIVPTHPIVIEGVLAGLPGERRAQLHARVADALRAAGAPLPAIAAHEAEAHPSGDARRAGSLADAARQALDAGTPAIAARLFARAQAEGALTATAATQLALEEGKARVMAGEAERGLELIRGAVRDVDDPRLRAERYLELGDAAYMTSDYATAGEAYAAARTALASAASVSDAERRMILAKVAANEWTFAVNPMTGLLGEIEQLEAQPEHLDSGADRAIFGVLSLADALAGVEGAERRARRAFAGVRSFPAGAADDPLTYMVSASLNLLALVDECELWLSAAVADARDSGSVQGFGTASFARGALRVAHGRLRAGLADLEAARNTAELGWRTYFPAMQYFLVKGYVRAGEIDAAGEVVMLDAGPQPETFATVGLAARLLHLVAAGRASEAVAFAERSLVHSQNVLPLIGEDWRMPLAEAYAACGDPDAARQQLREAHALGMAGVSARSHAERLIHSARLEGDPAVAERLYRRVLRLVGPGYHEAAEAHLGLAELAATRGDHVPARRHARDAFRYAVQEGARPLALRARAVISRVASGDELLPPDERVGLLSPSEYRIAEAAARGERNREIARSQFVTVKTVEFHLGNIYRKLGIRSRAELATILGAAPHAPDPD